VASHNEQRPLAVYLLTESKGGLKLTRSGGDPNGRVGLSFRGRLSGDVSAYNATTGDFINFMTRYVQLDRPIIDRTGLLGRYDFTWTGRRTNRNLEERSFRPQRVQPLHPRCIRLFRNS
jgi:uncharacterized protein (TIGR03435 family)